MDKLFQQPVKPFRQSIFVRTIVWIWFHDQFHTIKINLLNQEIIFKSFVQFKNLFLVIYRQNTVKIWL